MIDLELSKVIVKVLGENHSLVTITPLPAGYGVTLGNSLRRVLLSSLDGAAITGIKIDGVSHEFSTIKGVKDSVVDIILNLKQVRFLSHSSEPVILKLEKSKAGPVIAKDIQVNADVEIVTPDVYITSLEDKVKFTMEVVIEKGVGYSPISSRDKKKNKETGLIEIDTFFSPVRMVKYDVTNTRVGEHTNLDQLQVEIKTDGSMKPEDALAKASGILRNYHSLLDAKCLTPEKTVETILEAQAQKSKEVEEGQKRRKYTPVEVLKLSPRTLNALVNNDVTSVEQLVLMNGGKLANLKGFGARAMMEVQEALVKNNLDFSNDN